MNNNLPINIATSSKYLHLIIDHKLSFADQIKQIKSKVSRAIGILSKTKPY